MQESGSPVLAFHLLVAGSATKSLDIRTFGSEGTHGRNFYYPCAERKSKREPRSVAVTGGRKERRHRNEKGRESKRRK